MFYESLGIVILMNLINTKSQYGSFSKFDETILIIEYL